jgi:UDP-N-acetylmuramate--alanine ligase
LPRSPDRVFLVGIGGIGVSGLAQLLRRQGHEVAGSDRRFEGAGKDELYAGLRRLGIRLFAQDGRGIEAWKPAAVIASAAVEETNPDLVAARRLGLPALSRSRCLADALNRWPDALQIAVAGSCGKTSVTGWLASALVALGQPVVMVNGGFVNEFENGSSPGNVRFEPEPVSWSSKSTKATAA